MKVSHEQIPACYLCNGEYVSALVVLNEVGDCEHYGAHAETEEPGEEHHPPALAGLHDDGVPHALVDAEIPVHSQHHQRHQSSPHDGCHHPLYSSACEGPGLMVTWLSPMYGH